MDNERKSRLTEVKVPMLVSVGETMITVDELSAMGPGTIIELNKMAGEPADVYVSGEKVAQCEVVVIDENFAVRIKNMVNKEG